MKNSQDYFEKIVKKPDKMKNLDFLVWSDQIKYQEVQNGFTIQ